MLSIVRIPSYSFCNKKNHDVKKNTHTPRPVRFGKLNRAVHLRDDGSSSSSDCLLVFAGVVPSTSSTPSFLYVAPSLDSVEPRGGLSQSCCIRLNPTTFPNVPVVTFLVAAAAGDESPKKQKKQ